MVIRTMKDIQAAAAKLAAKHKEFLAKAFREELGCLPSDCELVQHAEGLIIRWYFRKRDKSHDKD